MLLEKIESLKDDIWYLRKEKVIEAMVYNTGIDREFTDLLLKYKVYRLNELHVLRGSLGYFGNKSY